MQNSHTEQEKIKLTLLTRTPNTEDDILRLINQVRNEIEKQHQPVSVTVGVVQGEEVLGEFAQTWERALSTQPNWQRVDISRALANLIACKDDVEQKWLRTAGAITSAVMKNFLIPKIEEIIDDDKRVTHAQIANDIEDKFLNPEKISKALKSDIVDLSFTPIIQSGGLYHLHVPDDVNSSSVHLESADTPLHPSCIVLCLGGKYKQYCATIGRTLLVNPTPQVRADYELLCTVQTRIIEALRPGVTLAQVYRQAQDMLQNAHPRLWKHFLKNCGFGTGIECIEREYTIDATNTTVTVEEGMVFTVRVGFENLTQDVNDPKARVYSLLLADTVLVKRDGCEELTKCKKKFSEVSYFLEVRACQSRFSYFQLSLFYHHHHHLFYESCVIDIIIDFSLSLSPSSFFPFSLDWNLDKTGVQEHSSN